ncbi:signal peptidase I [Halalkalibacterium ligniniphilum]|uniref:signal peptidase I n=1 Tax=Halalkalibacterium ligniniphilum TaxID=1134413 RepID=UPI000345C99C
MQSIRNEVFDWLKAIVVALLLAFIIRTFLFTSYEVSGESMMPTAKDGERFIVNKMEYDFMEPERFDMIVFHATEQEDYIKRVIGLPGDRIRYENDVLYINDEPVDEPFLDERKAAYEGLYTNDFNVDEPVPPGHVFVLGDNRPNSYDSRMIGFIELDQIVGKVNFRFWPIREAGAVR